MCILVNRSTKTKVHNVHKNEKSNILCPYRQKWQNHKKQHKKGTINIWSQPLLLWWAWEWPASSCISDWFLNFFRRSWRAVCFIPMISMIYFCLTPSKAKATMAVLFSLLGCLPMSSLCWLFESCKYNDKHVLSFKVKYRI